MFARMRAYIIYYISFFVVYNEFFFEKLPVLPYP